VGPDCGLIRRPRAKKMLACVSRGGLSDGTLQAAWRRQHGEMGALGLVGGARGGHARPSHQRWSSSSNRFRVECSKGFGEPSGGAGSGSGKGFGGNSGGLDLGEERLTAKERKRRREAAARAREMAKIDEEIFNEVYEVKPEDQPGYTPPPGKEICPCGGGATGDALYEECCGPFHWGHATPTEAHQLMRARYSAYVYNLPEFVFRTYHPEHPDFKGGKLYEEIEAICKGVDFESLEVHSTESGSSSDEAFVSFTAFIKGKNGVLGGGLRERSRFLRQDNRWYYREV